LLGEYILNQLSQGKTIYLIRPGDSIISCSSPDYYKDIDKSNGLTQKGSSEIKALAEALVVKGVKADAIFTSVAYRSKQSAVILGDYLGVRKIDIHKVPELIALDESECCDFANDPNLSLSLAQYRVKNWFDTLLCDNSYNGKNLFIVTHGGPISWILSSLDTLKTNINIDNASSTILHFDYFEGVTIQTLNCTDHLLSVA
jgi:broad specificity phosphatase PhoE